MPISLLMKSFAFRLIPMIYVALVLSGCLQEPVRTAASTSSVSWFEGIKTAKNLGGYPASIKVSWDRPSKPVSGFRVYGLVYDTASKTNKWDILEEPSSDASSYIHSDLAAGQIYSYRVRALDIDGAEDSNDKQMSSVAFDGIASARANGKTTATVTLNTSTGAFDEVRIYAQPSRTGGTKTLVATARGNVDTVSITGLHSGVKYKFFASAYMNYLGAEDGNEAFIESQTTSDGFGTGATTDTTYTYRGVMAVKAVGDAPNAPAEPRARQVSLTWPAFNGAAGTTKYRVIRASASTSVDTTTTTACSSGVSSSCIVSCTNSGSGPQTCVDTTVAAPPMTYHYVITLLKSDSATGEVWVEELPLANASDFYVRVTIPSAYMVLVQRDAANYDMCAILGTTPNPRKHQRCTYSGVGATPYNSGPGKPALSFDNGYYDFGYNLLVDRFKTACNWTRNSSACGANGCIGTNSASGAGPSALIGNVGDVYFSLANSYG